MEAESLIQKTGLSKVQHLLYITQKSKDNDDIKQAFQMAMEEVKKSTKNTTLYKQIAQSAQEVAIKVDYDESWCAETNKKAREQFEIIQDELQRDKSNGIKEKIRLSHIDMGHLFFEIGEYTEALKNYMRAKDYCTISEHIIEICHHLIKVNWMLNNLGTVESYCMKGLSENASNDDFHAMLGLCSLVKGRYEQAINAFSKIGYSSSNKVMLSCALSINDVAKYGVLCAITSLSRPSLLQLTKNDNFREYLELEPLYRDLLSLVSQLKYKEAMVQFKLLLPELLLDCYVGPHCDKLTQKLKIVSVVGVFSAFQDIKLESIAEMLGEDMEQVLPQVETLITNGVLQARIDGRTNTIRNYTPQYTLDIHAVLQQAQIVLLKAHPISKSQ